MSDAPILEPLNLVADFEAAGDFEKKHTPYITVEQTDEGHRLNIKIGQEVPHPNQPGHWIGWIELLIGDATVARFDLAPTVSIPVVSVVLDAQPGTVVRAIAHCNLHGLWAYEITL
ncbi:MAG: desulfoferrodoxin family protein [Coriobacteriia bacterium]|nr:desulfoferrodoxin family protein [Coriobacteriia bacterium]